MHQLLSEYLCVMHTPSEFMFSKKKGAGNSQLLRHYHHAIAVVNEIFPYSQLDLRCSLSFFAFFISLNAFFYYAYTQFA